MLLQQHHHQKFSQETDFRDCDSQGLAYISGSLAKKFQKKYPHLGTKSSNLPFCEKSLAPWVIHLSKGGLIVPSDEFLHACSNFEQEFLKFHGEEIDQKPDVFNRFHSVLVTKFGDNWPSEVLMLFARTRTFIRIKALNHQLKVQEAQAKLRKLKQLGQHQY